MTYDNVFVCKEDFDAWVELVGARSEGPNYACSRIRVYGKLGFSGVEFRLNATAILRGSDGSFYGRPDAYNYVRVSGYQGSAMNLFGKGARATTTWDEAQSLLDTLTGQY